MPQATDCVPNIGPSQQQRRLLGGVALGAATLLLAWSLIASNASVLARLLIAIPAWGASLGVFQARAQTCVALVARGTRNMDDGERPVSDGTALKTMKAQARQVYVRSLVATAIVTAVVLTL